MWEQMEFGVVYESDSVTLSQLQADFSDEQHLRCLTSSLGSSAEG